MRLAIISGKGGTGKTTIATSLAELSQSPIRIDGDVEASNMYLYYNGENLSREYFSGGKVAQVDLDICTNCGLCNEVCKFDAINNGIVNELKCEGCIACSVVCPVEAIEFVDEKTADIYDTEIPHGNIIWASMEIGGDGSGLLISKMRKNAEKYETKENLTILDGSPGIGCSVISSITANDWTLIVTEPTKSGLEDFKRIYKLTKHFHIPALACINKYNINEEMSGEIENYCMENEIPLVGKIPYDEIIIESINNLKPIIEYPESIANKAIREMWNEISENYLKI
ncbi:MAG: 4Fe-4S binding protein [Tissierellia bacterium]|nr:4Fe-4S binding protein [Tissierellia bacterium]